MSCLCRWEDELAEKVEYNADNTVKTEIVKSPFIQVYLVFMSHSLHLFRNSFLFLLKWFFFSVIIDSFRSYRGQAYWVC